MRKAKTKLNETFYWDDIPETVDPRDYIERMTEADQNTAPGARKRALINLRYAKKVGWIEATPVPHSSDRVFTLTFYRWLLYKYPNIQGLPKHNIVIQVPGIPIGLRLGVPTVSSLDPIPFTTEEFHRLQFENRSLKRKVIGLEQELEKAKNEIQFLKAHDAQRRKNCGKRSTEK